MKPPPPPSGQPPEPGPKSGPILSGADRERIRKGLRRCEEALHSGSTLLEENLYAEAVSRAHYAVIHAIMILLDGAGRGTKNPAVAENLFQRELAVSLGLSERDWNDFDRVRRSKEVITRDYLARYSGEYAAEMLHKAQGFVSIVQRLLKPGVDDPAD